MAVIARHLQRRIKRLIAATMFQPLEYNLHANHTIFEMVGMPMTIQRQVPEWKSSRELRYFGSENLIFK